MADGLTFSIVLHLTKKRYINFITVSINNLFSENGYKISRSYPLSGLMQNVIENLILQ
ncbi:hypothetical protein Anacy_0313 [Anabaena cylindrica PCC 7122]|uniref:Uncharacterized protein n=1 Tax=Anabaena cylindrica (strain ATCC 27899 / PCC 7122) TaxID=272123 RepID=K9ZC03_ANACC|nr:hypothetical protein Anacy_0313 [Anabaena cylindrica PCC 7122]BAY01658.1 hypothetical protein NIES19_08940 [Anabaena cylindrica PCC 7122]